MREKSVKQLGIRVNQDQLEFIESLSGAWRVNCSEVVRRMIDAYNEYYKKVKS